ncbi:MAG: hypothetical protein IT428_06945 [Planctomycetaceae bacterium]|nr:hypothetical protein [Planctomycetaceae bacterium]
MNRELRSGTSFYGPLTRGGDRKVWKQRLSPDVTSPEFRSTETEPHGSARVSDAAGEESVVFAEASAEDVAYEQELRQGASSSAAPTRIGTAPVSETPTDEEIPTVFDSEPSLATALPVSRRESPSASFGEAQAVAVPPQRGRRDGRPPAQGRRARTPRGIVDPRVMAQETPDEAPQNWKRRVAAWIASMAAMGYGVSLFLHLAAIGALSVVVFGPKLVSKPIGIDGDPGAGFGQGSLFNGDSFDPGGSGATETSTADVEVVPGLIGAGTSTDVLMSDVREDALAAAGIGVGGKEGNGQGTGEGDGIGDGKGLPFAMPGSGGKVTMKGSFTAWTVPEDPKPEEDYTIVIQIKLPPGVKKIPKRDLEGSIVEGTDKYRLHIPTPRMPTFLPVSGEFAQLVVPVPGARSLVRDRITVKSRMLKEIQTLEIEF